MAIEAIDDGTRPSASTPETVPVKGRYDILAGQPLPAYDSPPSVAFNAIERRDTKRRLVALVCDPKLPPRVDCISPLRRIDHKNLMKVVEWGVVDWTPESRRCPVVLLERPQGRRIMPSLQAKIEPMSEELLTRALITPMCQVMAELEMHGITHRGIRPDNLFYDDTNQSRMVLGECVSAPVAIAQPVVCEPLDSAMSAPAGRGPGSIKCDLYALGATVAVLLNGSNPCAGLSDEDIIDSKLTLGSYTTLLRRSRASLTLMEVLRGLLNDDPNERWGVNDLTMWVNGRRLSPKPQAMPQRAVRPYVLNEREALTARELAENLSRDWEDAADAITNGSIDAWLRRSLSDEETTEAVNAAKASQGGNSEAEHFDRIIARVCIALDPTAPIRYRDFRATVPGISTLLGAFLEDNDARNLFALVMRANLIPYQMQQFTTVSPEMIRLMQLYEKMKPLMDRPGTGFGVERVAYELNSNLPCRSPLLESDYVLEIGDLIPALDRVAQTRPKELGKLVDRHIAAFIAARFKNTISTELREIDETEDPLVPLIAATRLLAGVQDKHGQETYPALTGHVAGLLKPATKRFHNRQMRKRAEQEIARAARSGRLTELLQVVDNSETLESDRRSFDRAVREFVASVNAERQIEDDKRNRTLLARNLGAQAAYWLAAIAGSGASFVILIIHAL